MRVGVVGGTFDPIHLGHIAMAAAARDCAGLDRVLLVPSGEPPHRADAIAGSKERLRMCRLAVEGHPGFEVLDLEVSRPGPSYTVDTLESLTQSRPEDELYLVLGWDAARDIPLWHRPERVLALTRLVIVSRPGWPEPQPQDLRAAGIDPARALLCRAETPDIEAREIRRRLEEGEALDGLLDPRVALHLRQHRLYPAPTA
ncbi:MAG TPA: nicotinate-nucleotide adenylyltransferase [Candidatus Nitrosotalea sp.]|nr:nicotinate-nucleotide adenylyltransferase [Candidatus Nitrosotalea sp.]